MRSIVFRRGGCRSAALSGVNRRSGDLAVHVRDLCITTMTTTTNAALARRQYSTSANFRRSSDGVGSHHRGSKDAERATGESARYSDASPHQAAAHATKRDIERRIDRIHTDILRPLDYFGHVPKSTYSTPMVMLLGNHSAGKSTFINRLLGIEEQETGVAPTDDGFTVIVRGDVNLDSDGPSTVSNPDHQFRDLAQYGSNFVNHFRMKTRRLPASSLVPEGLMIVDTPGMIDTPVHVQDRTTLEGQHRGYDFLAVTRWFAQRSDVILLMFDPANPGTTGETLDVLTKSLSGLEHKFLILMNKVDLFDKVTDFARAYGTICWNLSKVIRMKDIPRIYTTFTPIAGSSKTDPAILSAAAAAAANSSGKSSLSTASSPTAGGVPLFEMDRARREVLEEVLKAPLRRLDNLITEMEEASKRVWLSGQACMVLKRRLRRRQLGLYSAIGGACFALPAGLGTVLFHLDPSLAILAAFCSVASASGAIFFGRRHLAEFEKQQLLQVDSVIDELFPGKHKTSEIRQRWESSVKPALLEAVEASGGGSAASSGASGIAALPSFSHRSLKYVAAVADKDVPTLRSEVAHYKETLVRLTDSSAGNHTESK